LPSSRNILFGVNSGLENCSTSLRSDFLFFFSLIPGLGFLCLPAQALENKNQVHRVKKVTGLICFYPCLKIETLFDDLAQ
jgi:hypothetical protein